MLTHYSNHLIAFDHTRAYDHVKDHHGHGKPAGFWVSVEGESDWVEWCLGEDFATDWLRVRHEVTLAPDALILNIDTAHGIDEFHQRYAVENKDRSWADHKHWEIDWPAVAAHYDGIIIAPYQWSRRLGGPHWYYGWDCASGVIWNAQAIESVTYAPLKELCA